MKGFAPPQHRRIAIALSIVGHLCALCLLALLVRPPAGMVGDEMPEGSIVQVTSADRRAPHHIRNVAAAAAPRRPQPRAVPSAAPPRIARKTLPAAPRAFGTPRPHSLPAGVRPPPRIVSLAIPSPTVPPTPIPPTSGPPTPVPSPAPPTSAPSAPASSTTHAGFDGLFSQNYPPAFAAPGAAAAIRASSEHHVRVRIFVDENGRAVDVRFVDHVSDPQAADDIRSRLLLLDYIPAECNGLHCDGDFEVTL